MRTGEFCRQPCRSNPSAATTRVGAVAQARRQANACEAAAVGTREDQLDCPSRHPCACYSPHVRRTPGISCERPICSTLVCFIPLFDGLVASPTQAQSSQATVGQAATVGRMVTQSRTPTPPRASPPRLGQPRVCLAAAEVEGHRLAGERGVSAPSLRRRRSPATSTRLAEVARRPQAEARERRRRRAGVAGKAHELPVLADELRVLLTGCGAHQTASAEAQDRPSSGSGSVRRRVRSAHLQPVHRTPGISCERPICSTLVCFIPLFDGVARTPSSPASRSARVRWRSSPQRTVICLEAGFRNGVQHLDVSHGADSHARTVVGLRRTLRSR